MKKTMLTTTDNPYDPFTQFDLWNDYDVDNGYHTCSYLARIAKTSPIISDADEIESINAAVDEIVQQNVLGVYVKVTQNK